MLSQRPWHTSAPPSGDLCLLSQLVVAGLSCKPLAIVLCDLGHFRDGILRHLLASESYLHFHQAQKCWWFCLGRSFGFSEDPCRFVKQGWSSFAGCFGGRTSCSAWHVIFFCLPTPHIMHSRPVRTKDSFLTMSQVRTPGGYHDPFI